MDRILYRKNKDKKIISIVVLTHNANKLLSDFLNRLYTYTCESIFELVILDNGSHEATKEIIANHYNVFDNVTTIFARRNLGVIRGRNLAYKYTANSEYVIFLDDDQLVENDWWNQYYDFLGRGYDLTGIDAWRMNENFRPVKQVTTQNAIFTYVGAGGLCMKHSVIRRLGLFDCCFNPAFFEDPDLCFRAYYGGYSIGWNYGAKIEHLGHRTMRKLNQQSLGQTFQSSMKKFRKKWGGYKLPILQQIID